MQCQRQHIGATVQHCRWLDCPPSDRSNDDLQAVGAPIAMALWSEDAKVRCTVHLLPPMQFVELSMW